MEDDEVTEDIKKVDLEQDEGSERASLMMIMIAGVVVEVVDFVAHSEADLGVHFEANEVTEEAEKVDWEKDEVIIET